MQEAARKGDDIQKTKTRVIAGYGLDNTQDVAMLIPVRKIKGMEQE